MNGKTMGYKLRACPFCPKGHSSLRKASLPEEPQQWWHVICECGAQGTECNSKKLAAEAWNRRRGDLILAKELIKCERDRLRYMKVIREQINAERKQ